MNETQTHTNDVNYPYTNNENTQTPKVVQAYEWIRLEGLTSILNDGKYV